MNETIRQEGLARRRERYGRAGKAHKSQILTERVERFGYHRKAAIRALRPRPGPAAPFVLGRPKAYDPAVLLPPLKAIWPAALQPCGERLKACLPDWLPAYEAEHRRLPTDVRQALLAASRATLDRLLIPARVAHRRRAATKYRLNQDDAAAPLPRRLPASPPKGLDDLASAQDRQGDHQSTTSTCCVSMVKGRPHSARTS